MIITHIHLKNWKNFKNVDVPIQQRLFIVGPNASGKSNLLDALRFLHDIAKQGGSLHDALERRGGLSKIRCLAARVDPIVELKVYIQDKENNDLWIYSLGLAQESRRKHEAFIKYEKVIKNGKIIRDRPTSDDKKDPELLYQTHLEQNSANIKFREISKFFNDIRYFHIVPQLIKFPQAFSGPNLPEDPFGRNFMEFLAKTPENIRNKRLKKIESILKAAVPHLTELSFTTDEFGFPHLEAKYEHWRPNAGKQREIQFSDGTLRLIGLFWSLFEVHDAPLLLEEPELSLNSTIIRQLPELMYKIEKNKKKKRSQIFISTHSLDLLSDKSIGSEEVLILIPKKELTEVKIASDIIEVNQLLDNDLSIGDAIIPLITPKSLNQSSLGEYIND